MLKSKGFIYIFSNGASPKMSLVEWRYLYLKTLAFEHILNPIFISLFFALYGKLRFHVLFTTSSQKEKQCKAKEANVGKKLLFFVFLKNFFNINFSTPYRKSQSKALVFSYIN